MGNSDQLDLPIAFCPVLLYNQSIISVFHHRTPTTMMPSELLFPRSDQPRLQNEAQIRFGVILPLSTSYINVTIRP
jgi:hypothetical protein